MRVIATATGFYDGARRRTGTEFEFDLERHGNIPFKKDDAGNLVLEENKATKRMEPVRDLKAPRVLPGWLKPATAATRAELANGQEVEAKRARDAALAAAGPKRKEKGFAVAPGADENVSDLV